MAPDDHLNPGPVTPFLPAQHKHQQSRLMAGALKKPGGAPGSSRTNTTPTSPASQQERRPTATPGRSCADPTRTPDTSTSQPRPIAEHLAQVAIIASYVACPIADPLWSFLRAKH